MEMKVNMQKVSLVRVLIVWAALGVMAGAANAAEIYGTRALDGATYELVRFDSGNVAGMVTVGPMTGFPAGNLPHGLDFVGTTLYASEAQPGRVGLHSISTTTGAATLVGSGTLPGYYMITDLAYNPRDGVLYGLANLPYPGTPKLYAISPTTGAPTFVGDVSGITDSYTTGLAAAANGDMFIQENVSDRMYRLPFGSLAATGLAAGLGFNSGFVEGMTIDWAGDGTWHYAAFNVGVSPWRYEYRTVNGDGSTNLIAPFPPVSGAPFPWPAIGDIAIIPEPATLTLLASATLALLRRYRGRDAAQPRATG